ncbi:class A beta-lactamase [Mycolicibacterium duvalii]|uniref:Beta-lactamase n=1 Tax=Mycolicibacterium duvalii TaxID=39688 RepID=A0A7I7K156_9MYCO|nr:class A beta-lactamase [Mycolicibacterium duvalii]MCV7367296.1 class A beta-lactamase [Mycolicibacterium duvalii]PEG43545.1 class A beta-lactamase [Mycolicibacterium duvalii]BBX17334.1 beta-lactamase [Mycolicibacterium duvalii]
MIRISRRQVLVGGLSLAALTACAPPRARAQVGVEQRFEELQRRDNALIGVHAVNLDTGKTLSFGDDRMLAMCSTFKGYAAAAVLQRAHRGELALTDAVAVEAADLRPHAPATEPRVGTTMTLTELCVAAVQQSDNTAANLLLRTLGGPQAITEFARSIGDDRTRLDRWETELNSAIPGDPRDTTTPRAIGTGYRNLLTGDALAPGDRALLEEWMRGNWTSSMRAGLPDGWTTADKTGSGDYGTSNDVGVAYGPAGQRLLLSLMVRSAGEDPDAPSLRPLIGELAALAVAELDHRQ